MPSHGLIDLAGCHDVVVVKPSSLGDVVHALPAVHGLKRAFPDLRLHWVVNEEWAPLLESNPDLVSVIAFPRRQLRGLGAPAGFLRWCRANRRSAPEGFDLAVDFQGLLRSILIAKGLGARAVAGLSDAREGASWFYRWKADVGGLAHAVDRYFALSRMLGGRVDDPCYPLPAGQPVSGLDAETLASSILLHPYSRGEGKSLPDDLITALAERVAPRPLLVVGVRPGGPPAWPANILDHSNKTNIPQLLHLLRGASATVSVDSGPMHLAAALPPPLLGLHTWSDPRKVGPWRAEARVWKSGRIVKVADLPAQPDEWCAGDGKWDPALPDQVAEWIDGLG